MLASPHDDWCLKEANDREYKTSAEERFFRAVENPKPATQALKDLFRDYGKQLVTDSR